MKIFRIIFLIMVIKSAIALGQQNTSICDIVNEDSIYLLDSNITNKYNLISKIIKDELIILDNSFLRTSEFFIYSVYYPDNGERFKVLIPDSIWDERNWIVDFVITEGNMFLLQGESLFVFNKFDSLYYLFKRIDLKNTCYYLNLIYDELIAYNAGLHSGKADSLSDTYLISIDMKTYELNKQLLTNPEGMGWIKIQPRKLIDINYNFIALSNATNYTIRIINRQTGLIDTLKRKPKAWVKTQYKTSVNGSTTPYSNLDLVEALSKRSLIQRVNFLSNNKLLIVWTSPPENDDYYYDLYFDLWDYDNGSQKWELIYSDLKNCDDKDSLFSISNLLISSFVLSGNSILSIHHIPYNVEPYLGKRKNDVKKTFEDYYRNQKPRYSIIRKKIR